MQTYTIKLTGIIQGVGFRPFVYKIAKKNNIKGFVQNDNQGVFITAQGNKKNLAHFLKDLKNPPKVAKIHSCLSKKINNSEIFCDFTITQSKTNSLKTAIIPADIALCKECKKELFSKKNRRFLYPFISCTNCGARYSLIKKLPYDRKNTEMADFSMCEKCQREYENPDSRRFHSEINCCKDCGPKLFFTKDLQELPNLLDSKIASHIKTMQNPLKCAIDSLKKGEILALKGIGGYTLICDARNKNAIKTLRERKKRPKKPFAIMFKNIKMLEKYAKITTKEKGFLKSQIAPITLCQAKPDSKLPFFMIAPNLLQIGAILPYAPLHHLLFREIDFPLIFTSANISGEPLIKDLCEISSKLNKVCDGALFYNRDIYQSIDDSLVQCVDNKMQVLRRSRGFLNDVSLLNTLKSEKSFLAFGAEQKSTFCLNIHSKTLLSPYLGDLTNLSTLEHFQKNLQLFSKNYETKINTFILDMHPNYTQRKLANKDCKIYEVQHHFAHLLSNLAENSTKKETLGVIFDGTGYGSDGNIWGGEFLSWNPKIPCDFERIAYFAPFRLIGGENAIKDLRRLALEGLLCARIQDFNLPFIYSLKKDFGENILDFFINAHTNPKNPQCHSVGRIFDMVTCICGLLEKMSFEGEGGMLLEALAKKALLKKIKPKSYSFCIEKKEILWYLILKEILQDLALKTPLESIALNFHYTLAKIIKKISKNYKSIALSGGCFQNKVLCELVLKEVKNAKLNLEIPCNDSGISFGQNFYKKLLG